MTSAPHPCPRCGQRFPPLKVIPLGETTVTLYQCDQCKEGTEPYRWGLWPDGTIAADSADPQSEF